MLWIGNVLIFLGLWRLGSKKRDAFYWSIVGEAIYTWYGIENQIWSLVFLCIALLLNAVRGAYLWNKKDSKSF